MLSFPEILWDYYFDEDYQRLVHLTDELLRKETESKKKKILKALHNYALGCDLWEKSYNFPKILELLQMGIATINSLTETLDQEDNQLCKGIQTMCEINHSAAMVENAMIFNDPKGMISYAEEASKIADSAIDQIGEPQSKTIEDLIDLIEGYKEYVLAYQKYAEIYVSYREEANDFAKIFLKNKKEIQTSLLEMITEDDRITASELKGLVANLDAVYNYWTSDDPKIQVNKSQHYLSASFYTGNSFSDFLLETCNNLSASEISDLIFQGEISVESGGIDGLDDFLQTTIGEEYADLLHLILLGGSINILNKEIEYNIHFMIRRFGTGSIIFELSVDDTSISDFRMLQTIIGPQVGITEISFQDKTFQRLNEVSKYLYDRLGKYEKQWLAHDAGAVIEFLTMDAAPYDSDRTWFSRSVIQEVSLKYKDRIVEVTSYEQLKESYEFNGLIASLVEGRPSLDDWMQIPEIAYTNLAKIRLHKEDLILFDTHTLTIFLPSKPDYILQGVLSTGLLINDISTLINSFDVMAENVRSDLIYQVNQAKLMLEQVEIDKIKADLKILRRNVIEVTEFELRALQSIQLLKSQSTIKYPDHAKFVLKFIDQSTISATIDSLEDKISIIKESQEGILRTADDLVAKYQEEVSESQQRLVRVITLIGAGVAQITIIDDILAVFQSQGLITGNTGEKVKLAVIILAFLLSGIAITWLGIGYLNSKRNIFD